MEISYLVVDVPEEDEEERENNHMASSLFDYSTLRMSDNSKSVITSSIIVRSKAILIDGKIKIVEESFISYLEDPFEPTNTLKLKPLVMIKGCNQKVRNVFHYVYIYHPFLTLLISSSSVLALLPPSQLSF
jgi:hypothetical protein